MVIKVENPIEEGRKDYAVLLPHNDSDEIDKLRKSLIWAIKLVANNKDNCGELEELYFIADLLDNLME